MTTVASFLGDVIVSGTINMTTLTIPSLVSGSLPRTNLTQETGEYPLLPELARRHDHPALASPETPADDDLGVPAGTFGSNTLYVTAELDAAP